MPNLGVGVTHQELGESAGRVEKFEQEHGDVQVELADRMLPSLGLLTEW